MSAMLRRQLLSVVFFGVSAVLSMAQTVPDVLSVNDGGQARQFDVSRTEAQRVRKEDGTQEIITIPSQGSSAAAAAHLRQLERTRGQRHDLVLYERGSVHSEATRRIVTRQAVAQLQPGTDAGALKTAVSASAVTLPAYAPGFAVFDFAGAAEALAGVTALRAQPGVISAEIVLARQFHRRFVPNDPRYAYSDTNTAYQWHLKNTGQNDGTAGEDVGNIETVWDTYRGNGITISIVDDGLQINHPDLAANAANTLHRDWNDNTPNDPTGRPAQDNHGTNCAGVAAGIGNNGIGIVGAAMNARLVGLRLIAGNVGDVQNAEALGWRPNDIHISNNSWGPPDEGTDLAGPGPLTLAAIENAVKNGRGGRGVIYMWAAGNGQAKNDRSNYDGYNNSPYTLSVGAVDDIGGATNYSEFGANLVISAHSDGRQGITTTNNANYTDNFGGTSSATPLASGVVALMLQANPNLGWRDVQEIMIRSARKNAPANSDWGVNGAGFNFNHRFGAGVVNAQAAVNMALTWTNLGTRRSHIVSESALNVAIPDNNATGITRTFDLTAVEAMRLEHVVLSVGITHPRRGDLDIRITAPSGFTSIFFVPHNDVQANVPLTFPFLSVRHWGENIQGTWTVTISDPTVNNAGTLQDVKLEFYGTRATPLAATPVVTSPSNVTGRQGRLITYQITANNNPASFSATNLPAGLNLNTTTGLISGTTAASGSIAITVSAINGAGTGTQNVTLDIADDPGTTFAEFGAARFSAGQLADPAISGAAADPDHDGQPNLLEFAFGGNPFDDSVSNQPHVIGAPGSSFFEYVTDNTTSGITVTPQSSDTLTGTDWTDLVPVQQSVSGTLTTWRVALPTSGVNRRFYRVVVTQP